MDHVQVEIQADRPGVALGHSRAEYNRLRAELEELTGNPVQLHIVKDAGPPKGRKEHKWGPGIQRAEDWASSAGLWASR